MARAHVGFALALACAAAAAAGACGNSGDPLSQFKPDSGASPGEPGNPGAAGTPGSGNPGFGDPGGEAGVGEVIVAPANAALDVDPAQTIPTLDFKALVAGAAVTATWSLDRGEIGSIDAATGRFTPKTTLGGTATVTAAYRGKQASTKVTVRLHIVQNGGPAPGDAGTGTGGNGGVGGEGAGGQVDAAKQSVLRGAPQALANLGWVYPYEGTVWPRGILAPLLQWSLPGGQDFDAVWIRVSEGAFSYDGFFAKPGPTVFQRHPIPQAAWRALGYSNAGEDVTVTLVFAKGGAAYGPLTQKWKIAQGTLKGTVYYNSYGTALAKNFSGTGLGGFARFGGATLGIRGSSLDPVLVAGTDSADDSGCRVCHSVSASGNRLVTQHGASYGTSGVYSLAPPITETVLGASNLAWPAIYPDGSVLLSNGAPMYGSADQPSKLYTLPAGTAVAGVSGLPADLKAATPVFSNDGKHVAFNYRGGTGADQKSLAVMDYDPATKTFSNLQVVFTPASGMAVWPTFMPSSDAVVFQLETVANGRDYAATRSQCDDSTACSNVGARGELWWVHLATKQAHKLDLANGVGHLPRLAATQHDADETLQYEPTISPLPSGGYAWMVFTSRRLYGNVATINPYWSDPRFHDISTTPTPKKMWVAALDLNAAPNTDPSHPAFYLPAQELLAGNSRGYWVVDPCRASGSSCETGDECCGGFCRAGGGGGLVCTDQKPACAQEFEQCVTDADCCPVQGDALRCVNGRCAAPIPR